MQTNDMNRVYQLRPLTKHFGAEVVGVDMSRVDLSKDFVLQLKKDLTDYRVLLFRRQALSGQRQVDISNALGAVESTFFKHPKSPHPDIFRVSNMEEEGCTNVGRSGWHVDGTFQMRPFMYQTMFFPSVAEGGDTYFMPFHEFYESLPEETRERYDRLWMVTGRRQAPVHPLVYQHPFRNETTMLFHCGRPFVSGWFQDQVMEDGTRRINVEELLPPRPIQEELTNGIESRLDDLGLRMRWQQGDFMINDNLGLAHYASEGTQQDWQKVGLRILHRTTIVGGPETIPQKADGRRSFKM
jgi:alpha-ketoglutarate-dependent taurine dioxygenase